MSSPKPSRKKAREKGQERTPVDEHEEMGQDASNSGGKASSCGGCAPKSSMPGMNYHILHGWSVRPISVTVFSFLLDILSMTKKIKCKI